MTALTDVLHTLVEHSTLGGSDKAELHEQVNGLEEDPGMSTEDLLAKRKEAADQARQAEIARLNEQLAALQGDGA